MRFPFLALAVAAMALPVQVEAAGVQCRELPLLFRAFAQHHYTVTKIEPEIEARTAERFIELVDPSRTLLLAADVERLRTELPGLFKRAGNGNCDLLESTWSLATSRAAEDRRIAAGILGPSYKLDDNVRLVLDPDERAYAASAEERQQRVRDMIHFQISSYLESGLSLEQAQKQLAHRFELIEKRLAERRLDGELPGMWAAAFAEALDPHSGYMSPDDLADFEIALKLSLEGIGAVLTSDDGFTVIQSLVPGGRAEKSGRLRPKDKIIAVAQKGEPPVSTIDMAIDDVVKLIRGKKGTEVTLTVLRESAQTKTFQVTIVRDKIDVSSQAAKLTYETRKLGPRTLKIGVIDLPSFYGGESGGRSSSTDLKRLLGEAKANKADGLVLDLSRNGGGLLDEAVRVSGLFIRRGAVVGTKSSDGEFAVLEDDDGAIEWTGPLAVLTSRVSASASEILAGALKDYRRAIIVGSDHTFGKGTVQAVVPLPFEVGAIRVTTGMFFLPGGSSTQVRGVPADIRVPTPFDGFEVGEDKLPYALPPQSVGPFLSQDANGPASRERWARVEPDLVAVLAEKSRARIATDPGFAKIREQVAKVEQNKGVVRLGDLRQRAGAAAGGDGDGDEDRIEELQNVNTREAVSILVDAIAAGLAGGTPKRTPNVAGAAASRAGEIVEDRR